MKFLSSVKHLVLGLGVWGLFSSCGSRALRESEPAQPLPPRLTVAQVVRLLPPKVKEPEGWSQDVLSALEAQQVYPSVEPVCEVLAVIEQESGFQANPVVKELPRIVRKR